MATRALGIPLTFAPALAPVLGMYGGGTTFWLGLIAGLALGVLGGRLTGDWWALAFVGPSAFLAGALAAYTWPPPDVGDPDWSTWLALMVLLGLLGAGAVTVGVAMAQRALRGTTTSGQAARRMSRRDTPPSSTRRTGP